MSKKEVNSYSILQLQMKEIENSKSEDSSKKNQDCSSSVKTSSMKTTSNKIVKKILEKKKESNSGTKNSIKDHDVPDRSHGDFFCSVCDSHMNSEDMWTQHINGKRHCKNIMKYNQASCVPVHSKYELLDMDTRVKDELKNVKDPIIGLSFIHEIWRNELSEPYYNCFLCHSAIASCPMLIEHVISVKHRMNYIREESPEDFELLTATNLKKAFLEPLVRETSLKMEEKYGRGTITVKKEKSKPEVPTRKRIIVFNSDNDDDDDAYWIPSKSQKFEERSNPYIWKSVGNSKDNMKDFKKVSHSKIKELKRSSHHSEELDRYEHHSRQYDSDKDQPDSNSYSRNYESPVKSNYRLSPEHEIPRSYTRKLLEKEIYCRRTPSRASSEDSSVDPRSYQTSEKTSSHRKHRKRSSRSRTKNNVENEVDDPAFLAFLKKLNELPTELFFNFILFKMSTLNLTTPSELHLLSKVISKGQVLLCNGLPPSIQAILKDRLFGSSETVSPPVSNVMARESKSVIQSNWPTNSEEQMTNFDYISRILNQAKMNVDSSSSVSQNTSHQQLASSPYKSTSTHQDTYGSFNSTDMNVSPTVQTSADHNRVSYLTRNSSCDGRNAVPPFVQYPSPTYNNPSISLDTAALSLPKQHVNPPFEQASADHNRNSTFSNMNSSYQDPVQNYSSTNNHFNNPPDIPHNSDYSWLRSDWK